MFRKPFFYLRVSAVDADLLKDLLDANPNSCAQAKVALHFRHGCLIRFESLPLPIFVGTVQRGLLPMQIVVTRGELESLFKLEVQSTVILDLSAVKRGRVFNLDLRLAVKRELQGLGRLLGAAEKIRAFLVLEAPAGGLGGWQEVFSSSWRWAGAFGACPQDEEKLMNSLLGRGEGSTPAGDDMLIGAAAVHSMIAASLGVSHFQRTRSRAWLECLNSFVPIFEECTTSASCTYLSAACRGRFSSHLIGVLQAAASGRENRLFENCRRLSRHGKTSGMDSLAGAALALSTMRRLPAA